MLNSLHIENMAVIASLDVDFYEGLSVITGETGSGKSVMIDSILFLLGGKPSRDLVRSGAQSGLVSAVFTGIGGDCAAYLADIGFDVGEELMLQRTLTAEGKSSARLNGRAIPQAMLRELSKYLVSIHGQNDNQLLLQKSAQEKILDGIASFGEDLEAYRRCYTARAEAKAAMAALDRDAAEKNRLRDILKFEIAEIDAAHLKAGEEEELLARRTKLQNAEKIAKQSEFAYRALYGNEKGNAALLLEKSSLALSQLAGVIPEAAAAAEKLMTMRYEVEDIANAARDYAEDGEGDPTHALNRVEGRLDVITKLRRKYGEDISAVLAFREDAHKKLESLENADEELDRLQRTIAATEKEMCALSDRLHDARVSAAKDLSCDVARELAFLDMPAVRFAITVTPMQDFGPTGCDEIAFCIATNPGEPMLPLSRIASGGELSRIMLALKSVLNDKDGVATAVFDEVDTGISGKTALKIGIKLSEIGRKTQVLCVTHSAQIASLAATHFKIAKHAVDGRANATVTPLNGEGRVAEVARILGGLSVTEAQRKAAAEMIEEGKHYQ